MSEEDKLVDLPTRTGTPTGHANERQMLDRARDTMGFETDVRTRPDGSTTLMRTKGGMPRFITEPVARNTTGTSAVPRGFVAHSPMKHQASLFDPYSLVVEQRRFLPLTVTYYVSGVAATPYLPRKWFDVWSWDKSTLRINGDLASTYLPFKFPPNVRNALPYLRPWPDAPIYGSKFQNSDFPKRIFAVGPESVSMATDPRWAGITPVDLYPKTPRTDNKALVCGVSIDSVTNEATMAQLYFTGDAWDSLNSGWAYSSTKVAMLLTPPFLQGTNSSAGVDMTPPSLSNLGASSGYITTDIGLPDGAEISLVGTPVNDISVSYSHPGGAPPGNNGQFVVHWPWTSVLTAALQGENYSSYTRTACGGTSAATLVQGGVTIDSVASNNKIWDARFDQTRQKTYNHTIAAHSTSTNGSDMSATSSTLYWGQHVPSGWDPANEAATRGRNYVGISGQFIPGGSVNRNYEEQAGSFSVTAGAEELVSGTYVRNQSSGQKPVFAPNTGYYDAYFLPGPGYAAGWVTIYGYAGFGIGGYGRASFQAYSSPASDITPIYDYYKNPGGHNQDPSAVDDINAKYAEGVAAYMAQTMYDNEQSDGIGGRTYYYTASVSPNVTLDSKSLSWDTRDYLLHDPVNDVYLTVDGHFEATQSGAGSASATLTVVLNIDTPWGSGTKLLYDLAYTYASMLPETQIGATGKYAIPSPQIRAIFAPKYREQGAFPGVAYVTQDEVGNGATPAILCNFVLVLEPYSFIGTDEPTDHLIHIVPCNLLEMLYAFVFSRGYGIDPCSRYPVTDAAAYNTIMAGLFNVQTHIEFRDGALSGWMIGLGNPYYADQKTELYRV